MATPRLGLRFLTNSPIARPTTFRQPLTRQILSRRTQTTAAAPTEGSLTRLWKSPVGPKTVHFWAPIMKWGLVLAGIGDFSRPAESLSLTQNIALMCTGAIWTRWCFVIKPKNIFLATVNFFVFCTGAAQVSRIFAYNRSLKATDLVTEVKDELKDEVDSVKKMIHDPRGAAENVKHP